MTNKNIKFEGELNPERFGRFEDWQKYKRGGHSIIYMADDSVTGNKVAIKQHLDYMPERAGEEQAIREAKTRYEREIAMLGKLSHPGIVQSQGYFFRKEHGIPVPYLVMEPLETDTIEDKLATGQPASEQEAREAILSVGTVLDYLHTANGRPIIYRDLKPGNVKVMGKEDSWPHKVVDFSESRIGNATMSGSVMGTFGYNAPEIYGAGMADKTTDFYSLLRIASHMIIGDNRKFLQTYLDAGTSVRGMKDVGDLNISEELLTAIEKGTDRSPDKRYRTLVELANDIGYKINRVPQTRQELENILGKSGLPVAVRTQTQKETEREDVSNTDSDLQEVVGDGSGFSLVFNQDGGMFSVRRGKFINVHKKLEVKDSLYETLHEILNNPIIMSEQEDFGWPYRSLNRDEKIQVALTYLQNVSQENPVLQEVLDGKTTLESLVREKKPGKDSFYTGDSLNVMFGGEPQTFDHESYGRAKQAYSQRRSQLCKMLGVDENNFSMLNGLGMVGGLASSSGIGVGFSGYIINLMNSGTSISEGLYLTGLFGSVSVGVSGGAFAGTKLQHYLAKRKLEKRAREIDGWVREARVAQGLEKKVEEGSVRLTEEEERSIDYVKTYFYGVLPGATLTSFVNSVIGAVSNFDIPPVASYPSVFLGGVLGGILANTYLKNKKLREKRLAAGLPAEEEMKEMKRTYFRYSRKQIIERLNENGFKKKLFRHKFVNEDGIEVTYKNKNTVFYSDIPADEFTIRATDERKLDHTLGVLSGQEIANEDPQKIPRAVSDGGKIWSSPHLVNLNKYHSSEELHFLVEYYPDEIQSTIRNVTFWEAAKNMSHGKNEGHAQ